MLGPAALLKASTFGRRKRISQSVVCLRYEFIPIFKNFVEILVQVEICSGFGPRIKISSQDLHIERFIKLYIMKP